jgi:hypothetical protein
VQDLIASKAVLQVVCRRYKHGALLFPRVLIEVAGENCTIAEISKRLAIASHRRLARYGPVSPQFDLPRLVLQMLVPVLDVGQQCG